MPNQSFGELDRLRHRSPSPMASSNPLSNVAGTGLAGWNGLPQEVTNILDIFSPVTCCHAFESYVSIGCLECAVWF